MEYQQRPTHPGCAKVGLVLQSASKYDTCPETRMSLLVACKAKEPSIVFRSVQVQTRKVRGGSL